MFLARLLASALLAASFAPLAARADVTVGGVKYEEAAEMRGAHVVLNGAGVRYKGPFKVYAAGLYTPRKAATAEEVFAQPGAKRMSVTMLRDIDTSELGKLFTRGVEDNLDRAAINQRLINARTVAERDGMTEIASLLANIENQSPAHIAKAVMASLDWLEGKSELRQFTLQLEMVALNLKNLK